MVYAGTLSGDDDQELTLGVSGRLTGVDRSRETGIDTRNLIMWDPETGSLWNQMRGEAVYGPAKGKSLDLLPAVFVGLGTWARMYPDTAVLDLKPVRARGWHFKATDLARGTVEEHTIAIGMRRGAKTLAVPIAQAHDAGVVEVELDGVPLAVVWVADERAAFVFDRRVGDAVVSLELTPGAGDDQPPTLRESGNDERTWNALTGAAHDGDQAPLARHPYIPCYLAAWQEYYPDGRVHGAR